MPMPLREDFDVASLRALAKRSKDGAQTRRLLALAAIYDGATRTQAAELGGVTVQIVRDWVVKFNAQGAGGLVNGKSPGQPTRLDAGQRAALARKIGDGPIPAVDEVVRWRRIDLCQWVWEAFRISISVQTMSREMRANSGVFWGYRKLSARPRHHAQAEGAIDAFKKISPPAWRRSRVKKALVPAR